MARYFEGHTTLARSYETTFLLYLEYIKQLSNHFSCYTL